MAVIWFEGWDIGRSQDFNSATLGGWDRNASYSQQTYVAALIGSGQAMQIGHGLGSLPAGIILSNDPYCYEPNRASASKVRIGGFVKSMSSSGTLSASVWAPIFGAQIGSMVVVVEMAGDMQLRISYTTNPNWYWAAPSCTALTAATTFDATAEHWIELEVDHTVPRYTLYVDGSQVLQSTTNIGSYTGIPQIGITSWAKSGLGSGKRVLAWDHLYMTDGSALASGNVVLGVAPVASLRSGVVTTSSAGIRPFVTIAAVRYYGTEVRSGANAGNYQTLSSGFFTNPAGGAWDSNALTTMTDWGFCYWDFGHSNDVDMGNAALSLLQWVTDAPQVITYEPGTGTITGSVAKSDAGLSYTQHLDDIPRSITPDDYLILSYPSACIALDLPDAPAPPAPATILVSITFSEEYRTEHADWVSITGGEDYESYFISGYKVMSEGNKDFQSNYVTVNYENVEGSSAFFQGVWNWATDPDTGKFGTKQEVVQYTSGYKHKARKLKVRGTGLALQFKVSSRSTYPFFINGWTVFVTGNQVP